MMLNRVQVLVLALLLSAGCGTGTLSEPGGGFGPGDDDVFDVADSGGNAGDVSVGDEDADVWVPTVDSGHDIDVAFAEDTVGTEDARSTDVEDLEDVGDPGQVDTGGQVPPPPRFETHFNEPVDGGNDDSLEDVIIGLLGQAEAGSRVRAAFYTWSRTRVARAFVEAHDRGVDVRLVVGNSNQNAAGEEYAAIGVLREGLGNRLTICREGQASGGCIGDGIQHNKFTLFSALDDGSRHVVFQSSANHTTPQRRQFNNVVIIRGDETLYGAYLDYWTDLQAQQRNLNYYRSTVGDFRTKAYFFPRASGDTVVAVLNNVTCDADSHIHVGMAYFTSPRIAIAQALAARKREGCQVSVIVREATTSADVLAALNVSGLEVKVFPSGASHSVHSKYLLINAPYGANATRQKLVWTGSHNYTGPALRNHDETLLKIRNDGVYDEYLANWQMMRGRF